MSGGRDQGRALRRAFVLGALALLGAAALAQETKVADTTELRAALARAVPGRTILLGPGDYAGFSAADVSGREGKPIVLRAADRRKPPIFRGAVQLSDVAWLELEGLVFTGSPTNGLNIDDGGTFESPSHHVVLRGVEVKNVGRRGNEDGIKLSGLDDFRIEDSLVENWGRGGSAIDLVGCRRGTIERTTVRDRAEDPAATGVQMKGGTRDVVVRRCRFENAGGRAVNIGGSTGMAYFRPKPEGFEAKDITVEGSIFVGSIAPIAFVGVDGATVRWNTFYRPEKWIGRILQETRSDGFVPCRKGAFTRNLVVYRRSAMVVAVNVGPATDSLSFTFSENYWFAEDDPKRSVPELPTAESKPAGGKDPLFRDPATGNFDTAAASPAKGFGAGALPGGR